MLRKKPHIEARKIAVEKQLAARMDALKSQGKTEAQIHRDPKVRQIEGKIRQARNQLAGIADLEKQIALMAEAKANKKAATKSDSSKKPSAPEAGNKEGKKEKKKSGGKKQ